MCPDKKLQWFVDHDWSSEAVEEVHQLVLHHWAESYKPVAAAAVPPAILEQIPLIVSSSLR